VHHVSSPLLVLAGAGSGKTRVLTQKIAHLINQHYYDPANIIAVTFTNKAAREMEARVAKLLDEVTAQSLHISTFHTLGLKLIRAKPKLYERKRNFSIYDASDSLSLIKDIMRRDYGDPGNLAEKVQWKISDWKQDMLTIDDVSRQQQSDPVSVTALNVYAKYEETLTTFNAFDFDDLIFKPVIKLKTEPSYRHEQQVMIRHLLVDEYQDTNLCQYEFIKLLNGPHSNFTVVGDDDQSIYAWRGARPENLVQLQKDYPDLEVIKLEQNYRSTGNILNSANSLIANNPHIFVKNLWSQYGPGDPVTIFSSQDDEREAEQVVTDLQHHMFQHRTRFSDYAILYRSNHQSRMFEQQLREKNIPYYLSGGLSFFSYSEIKDVMAYLRIVCNPDDDNALLRVINTPRRELGTGSVQKLVQFASEQQLRLLESLEHDALSSAVPPRAYKRLVELRDWLNHMNRLVESDKPDTLFMKIISDLDYEGWLRDTQPDEESAIRKINNVHDLQQMVKRISDNNITNTLSQIVSKLTLIDLLDRDNENNANCVNLMTLHAAKGLEFPYVYLVGMEEKILPHKTSIEDETIEEERRLAYVGITRAQRKLNISYAMQRKRFGDVETTEPSRFIEELPQECIQRRGVNSDLQGEERIEHGQQQLAQLRSLLFET
jgi:ATP-dependent DNA helicase Rep